LAKRACDDFRAWVVGAGEFHGALERTFDVLYRVSQVQQAKSDIDRARK